MKKIISILVLGLLLTTCMASINAEVDYPEEEKPTVSLVSGNIIYVDDDNTEGPWDGTLEHPYQYIYDGINAAKDGDTVYVFSGTYAYGLVVDKKISLAGQNRETTIINTSLDITSNGVAVTGFTIKGLFIENSRNCKISGNTIIQQGIELYSSKYNKIYDNIISDLISPLTQYGVGLQPGSDGNEIYNNKISSRDKRYHVWGIMLYGGVGGMGDGCKYNVISNNTISDCYKGISLYSADSENRNARYNVISYNDISNCRAAGIYIDGGPKYNIICGNTISNISDDDFTGYGIILVDYENQKPTNNRIYLNNFLNNEQNALDTGSNIWYKETGKDKDKGNYWDDYVEKGGYDNDKNGIGDIPYIIPDDYNNPDNNNEDPYPLMKKYNGSYSYSDTEIYSEIFNENTLTIRELKQLVYSEISCIDESSKRNELLSEVGSAFTELEKIGILDDITISQVEQIIENNENLIPSEGRLNLNCDVYIWDKDAFMCFPFPLIIFDIFGLAPFLFWDVEVHYSPWVNDNTMVVIDGSRGTQYCENCSANGTLIWFRGEIKQPDMSPSGDNLLLIDGTALISISDVPFAGGDGNSQSSSQSQQYQSSPQSNPQNIPGSQQSSSSSGSQPSTQSSSTIPSTSTLAIKTITVTSTTPISKSNLPVSR